MSCDLPECALSVVRKAKKLYRCCECNGLIQSGERYQRYSGIWKDGPCAYKTCLDCVSLRCETSRDGDECGFTFGELPEVVLVHWDATRLTAAFNAYSQMRHGIKLNTEGIK
jgi:hypothetical protein